MSQGESGLFAGEMPAKANTCLEKIPVDCFEIQLLGKGR